MTITLTRGEAQNVLNLLILWLDEQEEPDTETAIETLRAKLSEPTIDGWPLYSGLPPVKIQDDREANYKSFAQSAQVIGGQYDPRREWQGLTEEEMAAAWSQSKGDVLYRLKPFSQAIEAKLKEKNGF